jgi:hypothetical protein
MTIPPNKIFSPDRPDSFRLLASVPAMNSVTILHLAETLIFGVEILMSRTMSRSHRALAVALLTAAAVTTATAFTACDNGPKTRPGGPSTVTGDHFAPNIYPALQKSVAEYAIFLDSAPLPVEGYGIVAELPGTGSGEMPDGVRSILEESLRKAGAGSYTRGTQDISPEKILRSNLIAAVEVRGVIPPLAKKGDTFDLVVNCLPSSQATSLSGGLLWTSELKIRSLKTEGRTDTFPIAAGRGPVFLSTPVETILDPAGANPATARKAVRTGRIVGGGTVWQDRDIRLQLLSPSNAIAAAIQNAINSRFPARDKVASADSDSIITLKVPPEFKNSPAEFIDLVKHMFLTQETPGFSERKAAELLKALKNPTAPHRDISLALQALGRSVLPDYIQPHYTDSDPRVRFWAARAGAGLQDVGGMVVLQAFAQEEHSPFQNDAVAAISELSRGGDTDRASMTLYELLKSKNTAERVAAYQGLVSIRSSVVRSYSVGRKFWLDIIHADCPPMIYVTQSGAPRIALIGSNIKLGSGLVYVSKDNALTVNVPPADDQADAASPERSVLTASAGGSKTANPSTLKNNVTLYWLSPYHDRDPVEVKSTIRLQDIIARLGWIPDPRAPRDPSQPYIGASFQRITEMLASLSKDQLIDAQFVLEKNPDTGIRTPTDLINNARPEGSTQPPPEPAATTNPTPAPADQPPTLETAPQAVPEPAAP